MEANRLSALEVARLAAAAALGAPGVVGLHGGAVGELATYGDGERVRGVRVHDRPTPRLRLHLVVRIGARLDALGDDVRARIREALSTVAPEFAQGPIDLRVVDVSDEPLPVEAAGEAVPWS